MRGPRPKLGMLGTHSQGKIEEGDKGDLALAVTVDRKNRIIRVDFGTEVTWIGLDLASAQAMVNGLTRAIVALKG